MLFCSMAVDVKLRVAATEVGCMPFSVRSRSARTAMVAMGSCGRRMCVKNLFFADTQSTISRRISSGTVSRAAGLPLFLKRLLSLRPQ